MSVDQPVQLQTLIPTRIGSCGTGVNQRFVSCRSEGRGAEQEGAGDGDWDRGRDGQRGRRRRADPHPDHSDALQLVLRLLSLHGHGEESVVAAAHISCQDLSFMAHHHSVRAHKEFCEFDVGRIGPHEI